MKKRTKRLLGAAALVVGALGAVGAFLMKKREPRKRLDRSPRAIDAWARPGMEVTFRAELKPGRDRSERTFRVLKVLPSGRVLLDGVAGEHMEREFEPVR